MTSFSEFEIPFL